MFKKWIVSVALLVCGAQVHATSVAEDVMKSLIEKSIALQVVVEGQTISLAQYLASKMSWPAGGKNESSSFRNVCNPVVRGNLACVLYVTSSRDEKSPFGGGLSRFLFERHVLKYEAAWDGSDFQILTNPIKVMSLE